MASYGVFQAVCGFNCHGPNAHLEFAPRLARDDFRAAFTSAQGWGTIKQTRSPGRQTNVVQLNHGQLRLKTLAVAVEAQKPNSVKATVGDATVAAALQVAYGVARIELAQEITLKAGQSLEVTLSTSSERDGNSHDSRRTP